MDDDALRLAMAFLVDRAKLVVKASGAAPVAALLRRRLDVRGSKVGVILRGGNVSAAKLAALLA